MKKYLVALCVAMFLFSSQAFGACTAEEFQKELKNIKATVAELRKNPDRYAKIDDEMKALFAGEMSDLVRLTDAAKEDPSKKQELLDKSCDLYGRMNKFLSDKK